ncbi:MAG: hypothetical protein R8K53_09280 [Mariprofundaceae bacterium]
MRKHIFIIMAVASLAVFSATPALACSAAGPGKHVGQVSAVDSKARTFTIMDAETGKPIVFAASASILKNAAQAKGSVMVSYKKANDKLVAQDIHF